MAFSRRIGSVYINGEEKYLWAYFNRYKGVIVLSFSTQSIDSIKDMCQKLEKFCKKHDIEYYAIRKSAQVGWRTISYYKHHLIVRKDRIEDILNVLPKFKNIVINDNALGKIMDLIL